MLIKASDYAQAHGCSNYGRIETCPTGYWNWFTSSSFINSGNGRTYVYLNGNLNTTHYYGTTSEGPGLRIMIDILL